MKKFILLTLWVWYACISTLEAQISSKFSEYNLTKLDTGRMSASILYDRVYQDEDFNNHSGLPTDSICTQTEWDQLYLQTYLASNNKSKLKTLETIQLERTTLFKKNGVIPLLFLKFKFNTLDTNSITNGSVIIRDSFLLDGNLVLNPYLNNTLYATSASLQSNGLFGNVKFVLTKDFFFTNYESYPTFLSIDFNDGLGFRNVVWNEIVEIDYGNNQEGSTAKIIVVRELDDFEVSTSYTPWYEDLLDKQGDNQLIIAAQIAYNSLYASVKANILYGSQNGTKHTCLIKPLVIVEGIDFGYKGFPSGCYNSNCIKYGSLGFVDFVTGQDNNLSNGTIEKSLSYLTYAPEFLKKLNDFGYDIIYADFYDGATYMQANAMALIALIDEVNKAKCSKEELVIIGASMGGQIAKYALSYMEQHDQPHCSRLYISFDSPHQGANIPIGMQAIIHLTADYKAESNDKLVRILQRPAAKQLLNYYIEFGLLKNPNPLRTQFLEDLRFVGNYPLRTRNIAIANGSKTGASQGFNATDKIAWKKTGPYGVQIYSSPGIEIMSGKGWNLLATIQEPTHGRRSFEIDNKSYKLPDLDNSPGGTRNDHKSLKGDANILEQSVNFIPTISSLDLRSTNLWENVLDYLSGIEESPVADRYPFEAFKAPLANQPHVTVTMRNQNAEKVLGLAQEGNGDWGLRQAEMNSNSLGENLPNFIHGNYYNFGNISRRSIASINIHANGIVQINGDAIPSNGWFLNRASFPDDILPKPKAGSTFEVSTCFCVNPVIAINNEGKLEIGDENVLYPNNNKGVLRIRKGAKLIINTGGILLIHPGSRVIIDEGAELIYNPGAQIILQGEDAILELNGTVYIENGAIFTISQGVSNESGYILCNNSTFSQQAKFISTTTGSILLKPLNKLTHQLTTQGAIIVDESINSVTLENLVIESSKVGVFKLNNSNVLINNCLFTSDGNGRSNATGLSTIGQENIVVQNTKFIDLTTGFYINNGIKKLAIPIISNCTFNNCNEGLRSEGMKIQVDGLLFRNCGIGISVYISESSTVKNSSFQKNETGLNLKSSNTFCHIESNSFSFCDIGIETEQGTTGSFSLKCNVFTKNTIAAIKANGGNFSLSPQKPYNGDAGEANTFCYNNAGLILSGSELYIDGGYNNFISTPDNQLCNFVSGVLLSSQITNGNELAAGKNFWLPAPSDGNLKNGAGNLFNLNSYYNGSHPGNAYLAGAMQQNMNKVCGIGLDQDQQQATNDAYNAIANISINPNPTNSFASLSFSYYPLESTSGTIKLFNSRGVLLQTIKPISIINGSNSFSLNLTNYTAGVYYIELGLPRQVFHYYIVKD